MLSSLLAGTSLPLERVTAQKFRAGQIISDRPSGVLSVGLIVSGRVEVYSVALDGKDVQLNTLTVGECFGVCNLGDGSAVRGGDRSPIYPKDGPTLLYGAGRRTCHALCGSVQPEDPVSAPAH